MWLTDSCQSVPDEETMRCNDIMTDTTVKEASSKVVQYVASYAPYTTHTCPSHWSCMCVAPPMPGQTVVRLEPIESRLAAGQLPVKIYCQRCWIAMFQPSVNKEMAITRDSYAEMQLLSSTYTEPVRYKTRIGTIHCAVCQRILMYDDLIVQTRATDVNTSRPGTIRHQDCTQPQGSTPQPTGSGGKKQKNKR